MFKFADIAVMISGPSYQVGYFRLNLSTDMAIHISREVNLKTLLVSQETIRIQNPVIEFF